MAECTISKHSFVGSIALASLEKLDNAGLGKRRCKKVLFYKRTIGCFTMVLMLIAVVGCSDLTTSTPSSPATNTLDEARLLTPEELYGNYELKKCIYMTPVSSSMPFGSGGYCVLNEDTLDVQGQFGYEGIHIAYERIEIDKVCLTDELESLVWIGSLGFSCPAISSYKILYQHFAGLDPVGGDYRLYQMDNELWLVLRSSKNFIWSIYQLVPVMCLPGWWNA